MEIKCARCGKKMPEKHYLIQAVVYLGKHYPRKDLCEECFESFLDWFYEVENERDEQSSIY